MDRRGADGYANNADHYVRTAVGRMPVQRCARQMRAAWNRVLGPGLGYPSRLSQAAEQERWLRD